MKRYFPFTKKVALNCFNNFIKLEVIVLLAKDDVISGVRSECFIISLPRKQHIFIKSH